MQRIRRVLLLLGVSLFTLHSSLYAATTVTTRAGKGSTLTWTEMDGNFTNLANTIDSNAASTAAAILAVQQGQVGGTLGFETKAAMDADLAHDAGTLAIVTNDATTTNNTYWIKLGASGAGSWQQSAMPPTLPLVDARLYADFATAVSAQGTDKKLIVVSTVMPVTTAVSAPSTLDFMFVDGGYLSISGGGSVSGLKWASPTNFGTDVTGATITMAIASIVDGGVVDIGDAGSVTISTQIAVNRPCTILIGNASLTTSLTTSMFLVTSSGVTFQGVSPYVSKLANTDTSTGNIIQWGEFGTAHTYSDLIVKNINFTLPAISDPDDIASYRTKMGAIVASPEDNDVLTPSANITITGCEFHEGADQISLEQVTNAKIHHNSFFSTKGRGILFWKSDYYQVTVNYFYDSAGTAVNFIESFGSGVFDANSNYSVISGNIVDGTQYEAIQARGEGIIISGNIIRNAAGSGIAITNSDIDTNTTKNVIISHNDIETTGGGVGSYGIVVVKYSTWPAPSDVTIEGNRVLATGSALSAMLIGNDAVNIKSEGNVYEWSGSTANTSAVQVNAASDISFENDTIIGGSKHSLYLNTPTDVKVTGCLIDNKNTSGATHGVNITGVITGTFTGNTVQNTNNAGFYTVGAVQNIKIDSVSNSFFNVTTGMISNGSAAYLGHMSVVNSTVLPLSGYARVGDILLKGTGTAASASPGWVVITAGYFLSSVNSGAWTTGTNYSTLGTMVTNGGNVYQSTNTGVAGATAPVHTSGDVSDGTVIWRYIGPGARATTSTLAAVSAAS